MQPITALSKADIETLAPGALKTELTDRERKKVGLTDRYNFFPTERLIKDLSSLGWVIPQAHGIRNTRLQKHRQGMKDVAKHLLRFRNPNFSEDLKIGGLYPEILITNAHDGTSSLRVEMGLYRLVCSNGLVIRDKKFDEIVLRHHVGYNFEWMREQVRFMAERTPDLVRNIHRMERVELKPAVQMDFAVRAMVLRAPEYFNQDSRRINKIELLKKFDPKQLLEVRRPEDDGNSVWLTYNRIQEGLMKGLYTNKLSKNAVGGYGRQARSIDLDSDKPIQMANTIQINKDLWELAMNYAN